MATPLKKKQYLTKKEAAEYLGVSLTTFWRTVEHNVVSITLPAAGIKRHITRYDKKDLDRYMQDRKKQAAPQPQPNDEELTNGQSLQEEPQVKGRDDGGDW